MNMEFCYYHYEKSKHPKFYDKACALLKKAKKCAFTSQNEVDIFAHMVKEALEESKPEGHPSLFVHTKSEGGGQMVIQSGKLDEDIARLYYYDILRFLEYDLDAQDFFDVSERYEYNSNAAGPGKDINHKFKKNRTQ